MDAADDAEGMCRSREGAWIEIMLGSSLYSMFSSRSREGAWIEILVLSADFIPHSVAPVRERGLKW